MPERLRHWRIISEAEVQFPDRAVVIRGNHVVNIRFRIPEAALNGRELHVKPDFNFNFN